MRMGDKVDLNGQEATVVHVLPSIKEDCEHDWADGEAGNPEYCTKCGISFTRYIFCCCP